MGRGVSIQTQTITKPSKAAGGRLCGSLFLGGFWVKGSSWSITSCAGTTGVGVSGGEAGAPGSEGLCVCVCGAGCRRGWSSCVTQTRDLQVGLGGFTRRCGLGLGPRGLCVGGAWGAKELQRCESRRFHRGSGGVTGLE